jgi:hypothetical protein
MKSRQHAARRRDQHIDFGSRSAALTLKPMPLGVSAFAKHDLLALPVHLQVTSLIEFVRAASDVNADATSRTVGS